MNKHNSFAAIFHPVDLYVIIPIILLRLSLFYFTGCAVFIVRWFCSCLERCLSIYFAWCQPLRVGCIRILWVFLFHHIICCLLRAICFYCLLCCFLMFVDFKMMHLTVVPAYAFAKRERKREKKQRRWEFMPKRVRIGVCVCVCVCTPYSACNSHVYACICMFIFGKKCICKIKTTVKKCGWFMEHRCANCVTLVNSCLWLAFTCRSTFGVQLCFEFIYHYIIR